MAFFKVALKVAPRERSIIRRHSRTFSDERSLPRRPWRTFSRERSLANVFFANIPSQMFPHERSLDWGEL